MPTKCSMKVLNPIISTTGNDLMASESREDEGESIDRISMLPDDILGCILSNLSFKEATATSILSRRWRYSWTFTRKLDFNGWEALQRVRKVKNWRKKWRSELEKERVKYMRWVDNVIASCNNTCIEEFKVCFNLDRTHQTCIDEWVRYALSRKVEMLELYVTAKGHGYLRKSDVYYTLPRDILGQYELDNLRKIRTVLVNVSDEAVQLFLHNCPMLEELSISLSGHLVDLRITGPFPSLKRLKIALCDNLKSVEIRDVDLVRLEYYRYERVDFVLVNAPRLVNLDIGVDLAMFSSYLPQLEVLTYYIIGFGWEETQTEVLDAMAKMRNLKELRVTVFVGGDKSLLPLTHFLCALPCLESFGVLVKHRDPKFISTLETKLEKVSGSYPHLKEVTFLDYYGAKCDLELIAHFLENGKVLEDIVVHTRLSTWYPIPWMWRHNPSNKERRKLNRVEKQIQKLAPPPRINLSIF